MAYPTLALRDISEDQRKHMPDEDFAGKGRSFPIEKQEDVDAAVDSLGRAGDDNYGRDTIKGNIKKIAKRKGLTLPKAWQDEDKTVEACDQVSMAMTERGPRFAVRLSATLDRVRRVPIAILGKFQKGATKFAITREILSDLVANFRKRMAATVIDYEHASMDPEIAQGQPIPAAGWIEQLDDTPDADGVLWGTAKFTERAVQMLAADELRYFSPVIEFARDKKTGGSQGATLIAGALTLRPFLDGMPAIAMSDWSKGIDRGDAADEGGKQVTITKVIMADRVAGKVRVLADDGTDCTMAIDGLEAEPKVIRLSDVKRGQDGRYDFAGLPQDGETLIASDVVRGMAVQGELDAAVQSGKITPAQRPHYEKLALSDFGGFRELVKTLPVQVVLGERGLAGTGQERSSGSAALDQINHAIAEKRKADPEITYAKGWRLVASERPDLISAYNDAAKGGAQ
ncbi:MAG: hypothetical protein KGL39_11440 [Patescibacteria group bacterium]|nr:hypothetical protein [Patescibacteria group bacterium]